MLEPRRRRRASAEAETGERASPASAPTCGGARAPRARPRRGAAGGGRQAPRARPAHRAREPRRPAGRGHVRRVRAAAVRRPGAPALARGADRAHSRRRARRRASARSTGSRCVAMSYDYTVLAGTQGMRNHLKKDRLFELAERRRLPVVLFAEGGGGRPGDVDMPIVAGLDCRAFELFASLSGLVPLVGIASGYCFAGNAALLGCCDVVIATEDSSIGMGGPAMIEGGGLGVYEPAEVGPIDVQHANGVVDLRVADDARGGRRGQALPRPTSAARAAPGTRARPDAAARARSPSSASASTTSARCSRRCSTRTPCSSCARLRRGHGHRARPRRRPPAGRGRERPDPPGRGDRRRRRRQGGALHAAVRRLRAARAVPVRHARLHGRAGGRAHRDRAPLRAACSWPARTSAVPTGTIVLRKGYGLGAQAMAGGGFKAPLFTVAWPTSEFGAMGLEGAVRLGMRRELEAIEDERGARARVRGRRSPPPTSAARASTWPPTARSTT